MAEFEDYAKLGLGALGQTFAWMTERERQDTNVELARINAGAQIAAVQARAEADVARANVQPATATIYTANTRMVLMYGMLIFFGSLLFKGGGRGDY